jgi:hypothetical protein
MGLLTDLSLWYLYFHPAKGISRYIFNFYSLCEALFFFWLIQHLTQSPSLKYLTKKILIMTLPVWLVGFLVYPFFIKGETARSIPFDTSYEVIAAFLSGFALLYLVEREGSILKSPIFWLYSAVFFYCFCTFFIMSLLGSYMSLNLWPLNNIINIITYIFYSIGLWLYQPNIES